MAGGTTVLYTFLFTLALIFLSRWLKLPSCFDSNFIHMEFDHLFQLLVCHHSLWDPRYLKAVSFLMTFLSIFISSIFVSTKKLYSFFLLILNPLFFSPLLYLESSLSKFGFVLLTRTIVSMEFFCTHLLMASMIKSKRYTVDP